jgi:hypothetical protein
MVVAVWLHSSRPPLPERILRGSMMQAESRAEVSRVEGSIRRRLEAGNLPRAPIWRELADLRARSHDLEGAEAILLEALTECPGDAGIEADLERVRHSLR